MIRGKDPKRSAFTLVEVLIVLIIMGILGGTMLMTLSGGRDRAKSVTMVQNLHTLKSAAEMHFADTGNWIGENPDWLSPYVDSPHLLSSSEGEDASKCEVSILEDGRIIAACKVGDSWGGTEGMRNNLADDRELYDLLNHLGDSFDIDDHTVAILIARGWEVTSDEIVLGDIDLPDEDEEEEGDGTTGEEDSDLPDLPDWDPDQVYLAGEQVIYNGAVYEAHWYTQGEVPGEGGSPWGSGSPWQELTDEWRDFNIYEAGDTVTYNGAVYEAQWDTSGETPDAISSTVWQEQTDEWRDHNTYQAGDTVIYNGQTYRAKWYSSNSEPGVGPEWELVD